MFGRAPRLTLRPLHWIMRGARLGLLCVAAFLALALGPAQSQNASPPIKLMGAEYAEPTTRYNHAVLGQGAEWGALRLIFDLCPDCAAIRRHEVFFRLPEERVFEDLSFTVAPSSVAGKASTPNNSACSESRSVRIGR